MPKLYEYKSETKNTNYHIVDILRITECGQDIHIGMNGFVLASRNSQDFENTTGIVIPLSEIEPLIQSLAPTIYGKDKVLFGLNGYQIKAIISSLELSMDVMDGEIEKEAMPYDLIEMLKTESDNLLQRDKQSKKDA